MTKRTNHKTFDYLKNWDELKNEEQWNYAEYIYANRAKKGFDPHSSYFLEPKEEWHCKHTEAKRNAYIEANRTPEERAYIAAKEEEKRLKKELAKAKRQLAKLTA